MEDSRPVTLVIPADALAEQTAFVAAVGVGRW